MALKFIQDLGLLILDLGCSVGWKGLGLWRGVSCGAKFLSGLRVPVSV